METGSSKLEENRKETGREMTCSDFVGAITRLYKNMDAR